MSGVTFPLTFPLAFGAVTPVTITVTNNGTQTVYPVFTITGPCTNPTILNGTTGAQLQFINPLQTSYTVPSGNQLVVTTQPGSQSAAYYSGGVSAGSAGGWLQPGSTWFGLPPGTTTIQFLTSDASPTGATLDIEWSDAYLL